MPNINVTDEVYLRVTGQAQAEGRTLRAVVERAVVLYIEQARVVREQLEQIPPVQLGYMGDKPKEYWP